ncbi:MAG: zinc-dependent alcohol dehydrogenase family protein [Planctomycetaceae bacterium]|nr:zinc-dependent alcohol dehydrogenase family protein [Planctomycetaceae bacterium]
MRAAVFSEFGEPARVLSIGEVEPRRPGRGEVRIRMLASPINPSDLMTVRGVYGQRPKLPAVPGYEGVGIVEESNGGLLGRFLKGKRVAVLNKSGGNWSEQVVIPAKQAIPLPADLPLEQAASFFVNPATAWVMTREVLRVPNDEWLLQTAAGSALGRMIIRLGRKEGFRTLNVVRRAEQADELKRLGADATIVFDPAHHPQELLRQLVTEATAGQGVRYAIDPVGGATASAIIPCLRDDGRLLFFGSLSDDPVVFAQRHLMSTGARLEGFWLSRYMNTLGLVRKLRLVSKLKSLIRSGVLATDTGEAFPLEQVTSAVAAAEQAGRSGKVLLRMT